MVVERVQHPSKLLNGVLELFAIGWPLLGDLFIDLPQQRMQLQVEKLEPLEDPDAFLLILAVEAVCCEVEEDGVGLVE